MNDFTVIDSTAMALLAAEKNDAARWRALMKAAGHWKDGSDFSIALFQDDAPCHDCVIRVGGSYYAGPTFAAAADKLIAEQAA